MKCSPKYHGEERQDVGQRPCNKICFHWDQCLKELKIKNAPQEFDSKWVKLNKIARLTKLKK